LVAESSPKLNEKFAFSGCQTIANNIEKPSFIYTELIKNRLNNKRIDGKKKIGGFFLL
jgi:phosphoribosylaminoimidazole (AIR) synthetase